MMKNQNAANAGKKRQKAQKRREYPNPYEVLVATAVVKRQSGEKMDKRARTAALLSRLEDVRKKQVAEERYNSELQELNKKYKKLDGVTKSRTYVQTDPAYQMMLMQYMDTLPQEDVDAMLAGRKQNPLHLEARKLKKWHQRYSEYLARKPANPDATIHVPFKKAGKPLALTVDDMVEIMRFVDEKQFKAHDCATVGEVKKQVDKCVQKQLQDKGVANQFSSVGKTVWKQIVAALKVYYSTTHQSNTNIQTWTRYVSIHDPWNVICFWIVTTYVHGLVSLLDLLLNLDESRLRYNVNARTMQTIMYKKGYSPETMGNHKSILPQRIGQFACTSAIGAMAPIVLSIKLSKAELPQNKMQAIELSEMGPFPGNHAYLVCFPRGESERSEEHTLNSSHL